MERYNSFVYDLGADKNYTLGRKQALYNFGIFFDGTCNNLWDSNARELFEERYGNSKKKKAKSDLSGKENLTREDKAVLANSLYNERGESSYENDYSNVARLFRKTDFAYSIYIEGPGTTSHELLSGDIEYGGNKSGGLGFGHGDSGIRAKVRSACEKLAFKIVSKAGMDELEKGAKIIIDLYGFSRGAAAARNFIFEVTRNEGIDHLSTNVDQQQYEPAGMNSPSSKRTGRSIPPRGFLGYYLLQRGFDIYRYPLEIEIRSAALIDTVSSYEPQTRTGVIGAAVDHNFENDVRELHLDAVTKAMRVLHLTAIDELRENFSLTTIDSALSSAAGNERKTAIEIPMPGMHSDVGASYRDGVTEEKEVLDAGFATFPWIYKRANLYDARNRSRMQIFYERLIEQGWFRPGECRTNIQTDKTYELKFRRENLTNRYSHLPLHVMACYINDEWQLMWITPEQRIGVGPVIKMDTLMRDYPLPLSKPSLPLPFTMEGDTIKLRVGGISLDISHEAIPANHPVTRWLGEDHYTFVRGNGLNEKFILWRDALEYAVEYLFEHIEEAIPNDSPDPFLFAIQCYLPDGKVADKPVFPSDIVKGMDFSAYSYFSKSSRDAWSRGLTEEGAIAKFRENLDFLSRQLLEQLYLRRLRNRYLHWSSDFYWNAVVASSNNPRIVDDEHVICQRLVIRG